MYLYVYLTPVCPLQCVGYWKENLKSYLITYDQLDAFTKYRCWVYQRADLNKMMMSMSVGPFCDLQQDVDSKDYRYGAVVALKMDENERECKIFSCLWGKFYVDFFYFSRPVPDVF